MFTPGVISYSGLVPENIGNFERTDAFSAECWFCPTATTTQPKTLFSHLGGAPKRSGWTFDVNINRTASNSQVRVALISNESTNNYLSCITTLGTVSISINIWYHLIITYNGNSLVSGLKCYLNNVSKNFTIIVRNTLTDTIKDSSAKFNLGNSNLSPYFRGKIDEAVVYDRVLTATEVSQRYNSGTGTETLFGSAYLQYHLNELSGSDVTDSSANLRNGITIGSPLWVAGKLNNCIQLNGTTQYIQA